MLNKLFTLALTVSLFASTAALAEDTRTPTQKVQDLRVAGVLVGKALPAATASQRLADELATQMNTDAVKTYMDYAAAEERGVAKNSPLAVEMLLKERTGTVEAFSHAFALYQLIVEAIDKGDTVKTDGKDVRKPVSLQTVQAVVSGYIHAQLPALRRGLADGTGVKQDDLVKAVSEAIVAAHVTYTIVHANDAKPAVQPAATL